MMLYPPQAPANALIRLARATGLAALLLLAILPVVQARELNFRPLPPQRVERLSADAREQYQLALVAIDHINYEKALDLLTRAIEIDQNDPYLRFELVQVARYLGDTRSGADSIKYYDLAVMNLKDIARNPLLNAREQRKAGEALTYLGELRQLVLERDERRIQYGREIARQWNQEIENAGKLQAEQIEREARRKPVLATETGAGVVEGLEQFGTTRDLEYGTVDTNPGATRDLSDPGAAESFNTNQ